MPGSLFNSADYPEMKALLGKTPICASVHRGFTRSGPALGHETERLPSQGFADPGTDPDPLPGASKTVSGEVPHITVRVIDYVNLPTDTRGELGANAKRILSDAGVALDFIECYHGGVEVGPEACASPLDPASLVLRIAPPKFAVKGRQLGYAAMTQEGGAYITVFIDTAQQKARVSNLSNGTYLGHVVAHEIGHLLLGAESHSSAGIMRPVWRPVDEEWMVRGFLLFDAGQASRMRERLMTQVNR
jgi:hypothetical protein